MKLKLSLQWENFWIAILWVIIFMAILVWDQEKIVALNLVIFCYFLYYMISTSIEDTFNQRKDLIRTVVVRDVTAQLTSAHSLIKNIDSTLISLNSIILSLIAKHMYAQLTLLKGVKTNLNRFYSAAFFYQVNLLLNVLQVSSDRENIAYNLTVVDTLTLNSFDSQLTNLE